MENQQRVLGMRETQLKMSLLVVLLAFEATDTWERHEKIFANN